MLQAVNRQFDSQDLDLSLDVNMDVSTRYHRTSNEGNTAVNVIQSVFEDDIDVDPKVPLQPSTPVDSQLRGIFNPVTNGERHKASEENATEETVGSPGTPGMYILWIRNNHKLKI